ncbi:ABC transporter ATP-binding protein [bacterium]|jgi:lipoprotein-releasing system ATP-binding protein|nr:ABC transporter ATP-binding protein [bacterium]|tara:strand:+ start:1927 stop:2580 length:654 start_codon:yes stop_codon:yes gene_type:complete
MIEIKNLNKEINNKEILTDICFEIYKGDFVSVIGPSGSGKTTLLNILLLIIDKTSGLYNFNGKNIDEIKFDDNEVIKFRQNIGIMSSLSQLLPNINVKQNIMLPATIFEEERSKDYEKLISQLNIKKIQNNSISSLSSGEKQRVLLARALILSPLLLIADEPTANLDNNNALKIGDIMSDLNEENKTTIIIATHDDKISNKTKSILKIENGNLSKEI